MQQSSAIDDEYTEIVSTFDEDLYIIIIIILPLRCFQSKTMPPTQLTRIYIIRIQKSQ
jgi:hypothetical protein